MMNFLCLGLVFQPAIPHVEAMKKRIFLGAVLTGLVAIATAKEHPWPRQPNHGEAYLGERNGVHAYGRRVMELNAPNGNPVQMMALDFYERVINPITGNPATNHSHFQLAVDC